MLIFKTEVDQRGSSGLPSYFFFFFFTLRMCSVLVSNKMIITNGLMLPVPLVTVQRLSALLVTFS